MSDFDVVPDEERARQPKRWTRPMKPLHTALIEGKTVFVPFNGERPFDIRNRAQSAVTRRGLRLRARTIHRDGVEGFLMWAEERAA